MSHLFRVIALQYFGPRQYCRKSEGTLPLSVARVMAECLAYVVYSKWDLNPHAPSGARDFKSLVSTDSTIRAQYATHVA